MNPLILSSRSRPVCWMNGHCKQQLLMSWASILWLTASVYGWLPPQILVDNPQIPSLLPHGKGLMTIFWHDLFKGNPCCSKLHCNWFSVMSLWVWMWICCPPFESQFGNSYPPPLSWCQERSTDTCSSLTPPQSSYLIKERIILQGNDFTLWKCCNPV